MGLTYFKRFRMEIDLVGRQFAAPRLSGGYRLLAWDDGLLDAHAEAKFHSFRGEIDSNVFPCLGDWLGCHRLMQEIRGKQGFIPGATWLVAYDSTRGNDSLRGQSPRPDVDVASLEYCGTIQG